MSGQRAAEKLADGDYYEANQLYRTVFHRLLKKGETEEALRVAHEATVALLKHKQAPSATDMALLLIDAFKSQALAVDDKTRGNLSLSLSPRNSSKTVYNTIYRDHCRYLQKL